MRRRGFLGLLPLLGVKAVPGETVTVTTPVLAPLDIRPSTLAISALNASGCYYPTGASGMCNWPEGVEFRVARG